MNLKSICRKAKQVNQTGVKELQCVEGSIYLTISPKGYNEARQNDQVNNYLLINNQFEEI